MTPKTTTSWADTHAGQLLKFYSPFFFAFGYFFFNFLTHRPFLLFRLARGGNPLNDDLRQYLCSVHASNMASLPDYIQDTLNNIPPSLMTEHHRYMTRQELGENLRTGAIYLARNLVTMEQAGAQLGALEQVTLDLPHGSTVLIQERDQL